MAGSNPLAQSDEDFLNSSPPEVTPSEEKPSDEQAAADAAAAEAAHNDGDPPEEEENNADPADGSGDDPDDKPVEKEEEAPSDDDKPKEGEQDPAEKPEAAEPKDTPEVKDDKAAAPKKDAAPGSDKAAPATFSVPTSFAANGKTIELKNEGEALKLMQMGANYTRKLQELAPHRKLLMMLQNHDLLDESKLSFLIDVEKKNPEAIKKLVRESGIDIQDLDNDEEINYQAGSNAVTDAEIAFRTVMEEVGSSEAGQETITVLNQDLDAASKEMLWQEPELMSIIHQQRDLGIYDQIKAEIDRRRTLGTIGANVPFFTAYKQVGDEMVAAAPSKPAAGQQQNGATEGSPELATPAPTPVVTRAAAPKAEVKNSDKAGAASPTRATPGAAKVVVNPLALSDDDFLKNMTGRV